MKPSSRSTPQSRVAGLSGPAEALPGGSGGSLLERLAQGLEQRAISYCQWKGHWSAHRWSTGQGNLDLLVDFSSRAAFRRLAEELGFKLGYAPGASRRAGIEHYLGFDPAVSRLLHLQVHYRLLLGEYWKPVYRIPIEGPLLESALPRCPFRVPTPTHQYLVFVLRMMLRQVGRPLLSAQTLWTTGIRIQLESLQACSNREELAKLLREHLSPIDLQIFDRCVRSLQGGCGPLERAVLPWQLHRRLRAHLRLPTLGAMLGAGLERILPVSLSEKIFDLRLCLGDGGPVLALIGNGADTTTVRELNGWLGSAFRTMGADLGDPPRSWLTLAVDALLNLTHRLDRMRRRSPGSAATIQLLRHLCTARDRYRLYVRVRRFAVNGGIAICEGYPMAQNGRLVGPRICELLPVQASKVARLLGTLETTYYERILRPDLVVVVQPNPVSGTAAPEDGTTEAQVIDAAQPMPEVVRRLKAELWPLL